MHVPMKALVLIPALLFLSGCVQQIAVSTVGNIVHDGFGGIMEESDLEFAGEALPANLKLLEVMLKNDPENERMLLLLSEGFSSYALGFVEDTDADRARMFYQRAVEYGKRALRKDEGMAAALEGSVEDLKAGLRTTDSEMVPPVFWVAFGMGSYINLSLSDPDALADLPKVEAMMDFVVARDSSFYFGGAHIFLGTLYGSRPKILGGDIGKAKRHFEEALRINSGQFLMTHVYYARSVAVQTLDEALFDELLTTVGSTSPDILPSARLPNMIAKKKAEKLKERKGELF
jgi:hypothetical protein